MSDLSIMRQKAWDTFVQRRSVNESQYKTLIEKESNSPYAPMREYIQTLPKTFEELMPSFYLPMESTLEYPSQADDEIRHYNEIVQKVRALTEEMMVKAEEELAAFKEKVQ